MVDPRLDHIADVCIALALINHPMGAVGMGGVNPVLATWLGYYKALRMTLTCSINRGVLPGPPTRPGPPGAPAMPAIVPYAAIQGFRVPAQFAHFTAPPGEGDTNLRQPGSRRPMRAYRTRP
ncbi:hypothetical protein N7528_003099 [Penicillium herquei]|nr:hypothetical protein N7528_003099 [Penicillium herquei]